MNGLMLHCGANHVDRTALFALPTPEPQGPRHMPIAHGDFIEEMEGALAQHGFVCTEQAFGVTHDGNRLFGLATVRHEALVAREDYAFTIGFRGSHDQSLPRGIAVGSRVFVCDNLCFSGDHVVTTKQTTRIHERLPILLDDMVRAMPATFARQARHLDAYRTAKLTDQRADAAILEMGRRGIVNYSELGKVVAEWDEPAHAEHAEDGRTVWRLMNAATETMKLRNPDHPRVFRTIEQGPKLHGLMDELAELPLAA